MTSGEIPPMILQKETMTRIARRIAEEITGRWVSVQYRLNAVTRYREEICHIEDADGSMRCALPPLDVSDHASKLRGLLHRDGVGTWFSLTLTITKQQDGRASMSSRFNYDELPDWSTIPATSDYLYDLMKFPRDPEHIPGWLSERIEQAQTEYPHAYETYQLAEQQRRENRDV